MREITKLPKPPIHVELTAYRNASTQKLAIYPTIPANPFVCGIHMFVWFAQKPRKGLPAAAGSLGLPPQKHPCDSEVVSTMSVLATPWAVSVSW
jgi:hypothetical protein